LAECRRVSFGDLCHDRRVIFYRAIMLLSVFLGSALSAIRDKVTSRLYGDRCAEASILSFKKDLESLPQVAHVDYVSRDDAIKAFQDRHQNDYLMKQALDELGENPLGATVNIKAKDPSQYDSIIST